MYLVNCRMLKVYIDIGYEVLLIKQNDAVYIHDVFLINLPTLSHEHKYEDLSLKYIVL